MTTKKVSIGQFLEAMEANNVPHIRGKWFDSKGGPNKIHGACILGCAAINLGITSDAVEKLLYQADRSVARSIMQLNDSTFKPYDELVQTSKYLLKGKEHIIADCETDFYYSELKNSK